MNKPECKTEVVLVPPGCTSLVQPLYVPFNGKFKSMIDQLQTEHMHEYLEQYLQNSLSPSKQQVLITKWVGMGWNGLGSSKPQERNDPACLQFQLMAAEMKSISMDLKGTLSATLSLILRQKSKTCLNLILHHSLLS